jgi:hypothetical protein
MNDARLHDIETQDSMQQRVPSEQSLVCVEERDAAVTKE